MENFEDSVKRAMEKVVETHQHDHPLYRETSVVNKIIDAENKRAAFVLFEQIDTDKCTPEGEGWLGDQYRHSLWVIEGDKEPRQLYEDHAYIRATKSALTDSRGRDCSINLLELTKDGVLAEIPQQGVEGGTFAKTKVKITLEGKIEEPDNFIEQAENLVKRIGEKLGYDYLRGCKQLAGKNVAAVVWGAEDGSDYGYDTVYLVWEDRSGNLNHRELSNSRYTKAYLSVTSITEDSGDIIVDIKGEKHRINKKILD
jgi:hypothetical protein